MTNMSTFARELSEEQKDVSLWSDGFYRMLVTEVYRNIVNNSPVQSGFYKANHVIAVGGADFDLSPASKPVKVTPLQFIDLVSTRRAKELAKVSSLTLQVSVSIGTAVFYAADVEARHGVYQIGLQEGAQRAISKFKRGIRR